MWFDGERWRGQGLCVTLTGVMMVVATLDDAMHGVVCHHSANLISPCSNTVAAVIHPLLPVCVTGWPVPLSLHHPPLHHQSGVCWVGGVHLQQHSHCRAAGGGGGGSVQGKIVRQRALLGQKGAAFRRPAHALVLQAGAPSTPLTHCLLTIPFYPLPTQKSAMLSAVFASCPQSLWLANLLAGKIQLPPVQVMQADVREQQRWVGGWVVGGWVGALLKAVMGAIQLCLCWLPTFETHPPLMVAALD